MEGPQTGSGAELTIVLCSSLTFAQWNAKKRCDERVAHKEDAISEAH